MITKNHNEDIQDIISTPPSWLVRWGITLVFLVLTSLVFMSALIRYPDIVRTQVRINTSNAPKPIVTKVSGKVIKILVDDGSRVKARQPLAWLESTADHAQVMYLYQQLKQLRASQIDGFTDSSISITIPDNLRLGEIQSAYQTFYNSYILYKSSIEGGVYLKRWKYLEIELDNIKKQNDQLKQQRNIQEEEFKLAEREIKMYEKLFDKKVISPAEFQKQQAQFLSKHYPLQQTSSAILSNESNFTSKQKEIAELENQIDDEKIKFVQSLSSLLSSIEQWTSQYILVSPQEGELVYAGFLQENQYIDIGHHIFYVNPGSEDFFGEVFIPQFNMGKIRDGQRVLIKLNSYPFEEYGIIEGEIREISGVPVNDSIFLSKVSLNTRLNEKPLSLKSGMRGSAEIVTEDASLLQRLSRNLVRLVKSAN